MSVTIINPFEIPDGKHTEAIEHWDRAAAILAAQEGYIDAHLHQAVDPAARFQFVTVAEWESEEHFTAALASDAMQALEHPLEIRFSPAAYEVVRHRPADRQGGA